MVMHAAFWLHIHAVNAYPENLDNDTKRLKQKIENLQNLIKDSTTPPDTSDITPETDDT